MSTNPPAEPWFPGRSLAGAPLKRRITTCRWLHEDGYTLRQIAEMTKLDPAWITDVCIHDVYGPNDGDDTPVPDAAE